MITVTGGLVPGLIEVYALEDGATVGDFISKVIPMSDGTPPQEAERIDLMMLVNGNKAVLDTVLSDGAKVYLSPIYKKIRELQIVIK